MFSQFSRYGLAVVIFAVSFRLTTTCFASADSGRSVNMPPNNSWKMLYDFGEMTSLDNWQESSDTVRTPGMSKAAFVLQTTEVFQRAVFFSLLNPQPNGAAFAGFYTYDRWNLTGFSGLEIRVRGQGQNSNYKFMLKHNDEKINDGTPSYQAFFQIPLKQWTTVTVRFDSFEAYYRGRLIPDAALLNIRDITLVGIQIAGGVYSDFKQEGASSLEILYIKAIQ